jgi:hypothetical protein
LVKIVEVVKVQDFVGQDVRPRPHAAQRGLHPRKTARTAGPHRDV